MAIRCQNFFVRRPLQNAIEYVRIFNYVRQKHEIFFYFSEKAFSQKRTTNLYIYNSVNNVY